MGGDDVPAFAASTADKVIQIDPKAAGFSYFNAERAGHKKMPALMLRKVAHGKEVSWKWEAPF
jgi:hypothetical protein